jgi:hypothetical protein
MGECRILRPWGSGMVELTAKHLSMAIQKDLHHAVESLEDIINSKID